MIIEGIIRELQKEGKVVNKQRKNILTIYANRVKIKRECAKSSRKDLI